MKAENIQAEKLDIIDWILHLQDISLLKKIKNLQTDSFNIPQWHKDIVDERMKNTKKEDYISWEEMEKSLKFD